MPWFQRDPGGQRAGSEKGRSPDRPRFGGHRCQLVFLPVLQPRWVRKEVSCRDWGETGETILPPWDTGSHLGVSFSWISGVFSVDWTPPKTLPHPSVDFNSLLLEKCTFSLILRCQEKRYLPTPQRRSGSGCQKEVGFSKIEGFFFWFSQGCITMKTAMPVTSITPSWQWVMGAKRAPSTGSWKTGTAQFTSHFMW